MTFVSNFNNECGSNIEKMYTVEVVDFEGGISRVNVSAFDAEDAQCQAANMVENADYTCVLFAE